MTSLAPVHAPLPSPVFPPSGPCSDLKASAGQFPPLIGFTGLAGSGKTTAALLLVSTFDYHRQSFADPIRRMLLQLGLSADDLSKNKEVPHHLLAGKTPRHAMQTLGTEWGRGQIDPEIWLRAATHQAVRSLDLGLRVVFDDVRFDNEAHIIRRYGGQIIRIVRPGQPEFTTKHASESGVSPDLIDATLEAQDYLQLEHVVRSHFNGYGYPATA